MAGVRTFSSPEAQARVDVIRAALEGRAPCTVAELAAALSMVESSLGAYLRYMLDIGLAHKARNCGRSVDKVSQPALWAAGPGVTLPEQDERKVARPKTWPMHNRRDPLVAALFGAAA